ncbi:hypothetical protein BS17DRAFT_826064 [Gyrodon lividus]|nr:hypothetical protein BS17DRAFT_826064 [Gyrodon lividus]
MALSQCDALWLILHMLLKNGASIQTILCQIEDTVMNGYNPHSYNQAEFDLVLLVYCVRGANLLTALNQCLCLPAVHTVRNNTLSVKIAPTIGSITSETIAQNICSIIIEPCAQSSQTALHGVSLLTDEMALEEAATYHPAQNGVGGLCWKHAGIAYPYLDTYDSAEQLAQKFSSGNIHLGKEITIVQGERSLGLRGADVYHDQLMSKLIPSSLIYGVLLGLTGLNLYTGPHDMTLDFDYKHILKYEQGLI